MDQIVAARFWSKVDATDLNCCWLWTAGCYDTGYGAFRAEGKTVGAHRFSFLLTHGFKPEEVCHTCDNKRCVNPNHLYGGTSKTNSQDAVLRGLHPQGDRHWASKLTPLKVTELRSMHEKGYSCRKLAKLFGVSKSAVNYAVAGKTWKLSQNLTFNRGPLK